MNNKTPTPKLSREDFMDNLEPLLKPLYVSGSFDVFNLKVAIEKQLDQLLHLQAQKYEKALQNQREEIVREIIDCYKKNTGIDDDVFTQFLEVMYDFQAERKD